jgi:hypothetical protein
MQGPAGAQGEPGDSTATRLKGQKGEPGKEGNDVRDFHLKNEKDSQIVYLLRKYKKTNLFHHLLSLDYSSLFVFNKKNKIKIKNTSGLTYDHLTDG